MQLGMCGIAAVSDSRRDGAGIRARGIELHHSSPAGEVDFDILNAGDLAGGFGNVRDATGAVHPGDREGRFFDRRGRR
jgi:hypothetical protein